MQAVYGKQLNIAEWADLADEKLCSNLSLATSLCVTVGKALNIPRPFAMIGKGGFSRGSLTILSYSVIYFKALFFGVCCD